MILLLHPHPYFTTPSPSSYDTPRRVSQVRQILSAEQDSSVIASNNNNSFLDMTQVSLSIDDLMSGDIVEAHHHPYHQEALSPPTTSAPSTAAASPREKPLGVSSLNSLSGETYLVYNCVELYN